ncbi:hypothetical protein IJ847_02555 [Candidatus Saccharibacteria bacterium]|nr:hypothetical protein [Candidatus Saccharibacteria bacterium]
MKKFFVTVAIFVLLITVAICATGCGESAELQAQDAIIETTEMVETTAPTEPKPRMANAISDAISEKVYAYCETFNTDVYNNPERKTFDKAVNLPAYYWDYYEDCLADSSSVESDGYSSSYVSWYSVDGEVMSFSPISKGGMNKTNEKVTILFDDPRSVTIDISSDRNGVTITIDTSDASPQVITFASDFGKKFSPLGDGDFPDGNLLVASKRSSDFAMSAYGYAVLRICDELIRTAAI